MANGRGANHSTIRTNFFLCTNLRARAKLSPTRRRCFSFFFSFYFFFPRPSFLPPSILSTYLLLLYFSFLVNRSPHPVLRRLVRRSSPRPRELGSVHALVYTHIHAKRTGVAILRVSMLYSLHTRMYVILRMASWLHSGKSDRSTNCLIQHR